MPAVGTVTAPGTQEELLEVARLCTELARVATQSDAQPLLHDAARLLEATGMIVWFWDPSIAQLQPALVHGYAPRVVAQLPTVRRDDANATAAAFRTGQTRVICDAPGGHGALVVPLLSPGGCTGVLAIELQRGVELTATRIAVATILAAQLTSMAGAACDYDDIDIPRLMVGGMAQSL
jgi:hypothetical protein